MPHPATIINPKWSERLKKLRAECGITQNELSERIYLAQQTISRIECGKAPLTLKTAQKITEAFPKYRVEWLLGIDDIPYRFAPGKWIWDDEGYHCSECFYHAYGETGEVLSGHWHYCPNCGTDMREES